MFCKNPNWFSGSFKQLKQYGESMERSVHELHELLQRKQTFFFTQYYKSKYEILNTMYSFIFRSFIFLMQYQPYKDVKCDILKNQFYTLQGSFCRFLLQPNETRITVQEIKTKRVYQVDYYMEKLNVKTLHLPLPN